MKLRLQPGKERELGAILAHLQSTEQPGSGLLRTTLMRDQKDPSTIYVMPVFESEEKARVRERDPRREEGLRQVSAMMSEVFAGPPEFVDLEVIEEVVTSDNG